MINTKLLHSMKMKRLYSIKFPETRYVAERITQFSIPLIIKG